MPEFLKTILEHKREEVRLLACRKSEFSNGRSDKKRDFVQALNKKPAIAIIAEVKKASPSKGVLCPNFHPVGIALKYQDGGADAVSVLTDERFFQGSAAYLTDIRKAIALPVLRKDFIIDPLQVMQTAALNADAMLLIAAALSDSQMEELYRACIEADIDPLIEIHSHGELERALRLSPAIIGINNRNLETFEVSLDTTISILPHIPPGIIVISESGISFPEHTGILMKAGVHAALVGESLIRSIDSGEMIKKLKHLPC
jgi:indole-3-glycerol phosphate synthase